MKYDFDGNWKFEKEFKILSEFNYRCFHSPRPIPRKILIEIEDEIDYNPDPEPAQIKALEFILRNEEQLYGKIFKVLKDIVVPEMIANPDYELEDYDIPELQNIDDAKKFIGLTCIVIDVYYSCGKALTCFYFDFYLEEEHGLCMIFRESEFLGYCGIGDYPPDGITPESDLEDYIKRTNRDTPFEIIKPHKKYGKLKPWQQSSNDYYPNRLIRADRDEEVIEFLKSNEDIQNRMMHQIKRLAKSQKKVELLMKLNELKENGG